MPFNATWTPGPEAMAGMHASGPETLPGLVLYLDKGSLAITSPTNPTRWWASLRQFRDGADRLVVVLDAQAGQAHDGRD